MSDNEMPFGHLRYAVERASEACDAFDSGYPNQREAVGRSLNSLLVVGERYNDRFGVGERARELYSKIVLFAQVKSEGSHNASAQFMTDEQVAEYGKELHSIHRELRKRLDEL